MLRIGDRNEGWEYPKGCRIAAGPRRTCPSDKQISYSSFPEALVAFLKRHRYLPRDAVSPLR